MNPSRWWPHVLARWVPVAAAALPTMPAAAQFGPSTFPQPLIPSGSGTPFSFEVRDFNGDGRMDLAIAKRFTDPEALALRNGNAAGGFDPPILYGTGGHLPSALVVTDLDGDGRLDAAIVNSSNALTVTWQQ